MNTVTKTQTAATTETNQNIKTMLLNGAKVDFSHNGSEFVYTIEGVKGLEVSTKGYIIDKGDIKHPKEANDTVYITARKGFDAINIAYKSLILLLNGYVPKGGIILSCKVESKGYAPDNLVLLSKFNQQEISFDTLQRVSKPNVQVSKAVAAVLVDEDKSVIDPAAVYTKKAAVMEYVAEDGMAFETLEAAAIHQAKVAAAKEVAAVVLDYNKGLYGVAEKAYLRVCSYEGDVKPYTDFRSVMDNFDGVQERTAKEIVQFNKITKQQDPLFAYLFSGKSYSQETANEILDLLAAAKDIRHNLEMLSKQTAS